LGDTGGERNWTIGYRRAGRPIGPVYGDNGGRPPARGKGAGRPEPPRMERRCRRAEGGRWASRGQSMRPGPEAAEAESLETAAASSPVVKVEQKVSWRDEPEHRSERRSPMKLRSAPRENRGAR